MQRDGHAVKSVTGEFFLCSVLDSSPRHEVSVFKAGMWVFLGYLDSSSELKQTLILLPCCFAPVFFFSSEVLTPDQMTFFCLKCASSSCSLTACLHWAVLSYSDWGTKRSSHLLLLFSQINVAGDTFLYVHIYFCLLSCKKGIRIIKVGKDRPLC